MEREERVFDDRLSKNLKHQDASYCTCCRVGNEFATRRNEFYAHRLSPTRPTPHRRSISWVLPRVERHKTQYYVHNLDFSLENPPFSEKLAAYGTANQSLLMTPAITEPRRRRRRCVTRRRFHSSSIRFKDPTTGIQQQSASDQSWTASEDRFSIDLTLRMNNSRQSINFSQARRSVVLPAYFLIDDQRARSSASPPEPGGPVDGMAQLTAWPT